MKDIGKLFVISSFSKLLVLVFTLLLVRVLSVDEYSIFITVFTYYSVMFQLVSGVVERLYLLETERFTQNFVKNIALLVVFLILIPSAYFFVAEGLEYFLLILFLSISSLLFQVLRIVLQKKEYFSRYALIEIVRNIAWLLVSVVIIYDYHQGEIIYILYSFGIINLLLVLFSLKSIPKSTGVWTGAIGYISTKKSLIGYSVLAGLFPYLVFIWLDIVGNKDVIASLGIALRYQAILALVVMSMNVVYLSRVSNGVMTSEFVSRMWNQVFLAIGLSAIFIVLVFFLIPVVNNGKYVDSQQYFLLLSITTIISMLGLPVINYLLKHQKYKVLLKSLVISLVVSVLVLFILAKLLNSELIQDVMFLLVSMVLAYAINLGLNFLHYVKLKNENINH